MIPKAKSPEKLPTKITIFSKKYVIQSVHQVMSLNKHHNSIIFISQFYLSFNNNIDKTESSILTFYVVENDTEYDN